MNQDFYHREKQAQQEQEKHDAVAGRHQTIETWQIEQEAALTGNAAPADQERPPGLFTKIRRALFGGK